MTKSEPNLSPAYFASFSNLENLNRIDAKTLAGHLWTKRLGIQFGLGPNDLAMLDWLLYVKF
jgi:hypothetical protein